MPALVDNDSVCQQNIDRGSGEKIGERVARAAYAVITRVGGGKIKSPARARNVNIIEFERSHHFRAETNGMPAENNGGRVGKLKLLRFLKFRQKIGRTESRAETGNDDRRQTALSDIRQAADYVRTIAFFKRLLNRVGIRVVVAEAKLIDDGRADDVVPTGGQRVRRYVGQTPRRSIRAVGDAAEKSGNKAIALSPGVTPENVVFIVNFIIKPKRRTIRVVGQSRSLREIIRASVQSRIRIKCREPSRNRINIIDNISGVRLGKIRKIR